MHASANEFGAFRPVTRSRRSEKKEIGPLQRPPSTRLVDYASLSLPMKEASAFRPRWMLIFTFDSDMP